MAALQQKGGEAAEQTAPRALSAWPRAVEILPDKKGNNRNRTGAARSGLVGRKLTDTFQQEVKHGNQNGESV